MDNKENVSIQDAIRHMAASDQKTFAAVSREIGRNSRYLSIMLRDATTPRLDLMAKIASVCGYDLVLLGHGEGLAVTATPQLDGAPVTVERRWHVVEHDDGSLTLTSEKTDRGFAIPWGDDLVVPDELPTD